jgi:transposase
MDCRRVLEAIFYVPRTGIQWKAIPKAFGAASSIHRYFRFWCEQGFFRSLWIAGLEQYDELKGIDWTWMSADGRMSKAPLAREAAHCQQVKKICAHFLPQGQKTGLSAPIPQPAHGRLAGFPLNPLRPKVYKTLTC